ncbi:MAG: hypothetical protein CMF94_05565 [Candidatus Marinimicrobia bacterium]|mgnify:CR=1 FL=1|nr:hypothetical protein [Candidatus Neomarinimicrobiota bacterium]|tara:strand:- start:491 stop:889 length:399 start_codon:yes stop_codon:yes gene_type:complete
MYLLIRFSKYLVFLSLNFLLLYVSKDIDIEQFFKDIKLLVDTEGISDNLIFFVISNFVVFVTFFVKQLLRPFIEIFIEHYYKYGFYFLINILSISATFIVLRVYGYSRLYLLIYLIASSIIFEIFDRVERKF